MIVLFRAPCETLYHYLKLTGETDGWVFMKSPLKIYCFFVVSVLSNLLIFGVGGVQAHPLTENGDQKKDRSSSSTEVHSETDERWATANTFVARTGSVRPGIYPVKKTTPHHDAVDNWPNWRGPTLNGHAHGSGYATSWSQTQNVIWHVPLPGLGASTPAVWGNHIVITCAVDGRNVAICFDFNGQKIWERKLGPERPGKHKKATGCNSSPITDGQHVWVYYKSGELACLNLEDGEVIWNTNLQERFGEDTLWWDLGTSPVLTKQAVVVAVMQTGPSYVVAFERKTGELLWKADRNLGAPEEAAQSYSTPIVLSGDLKLDEPDELIVVLGADHVTAHNALNGQELWRVGGFNPNNEKFFRSIASPVAANDLIIAPYARGKTLTAIRRGGRGDVTKTHIAWERDDLGADVPTPAVRGTDAVVCTDKGRLECISTLTGKTIAKKDLPKNRNAYSASPIIVDQKVIVTREDGSSWILAFPKTPDETALFTDLGSGNIEEMTVATPVCVGGRILVRTHDALWCIGKAI